MDNRCAIVHYGEIGLKGKNRKLFEYRLINNIRRVLTGLPFLAVRRGYGRIIVDLVEGADFGQIEERLTRIFGIAHFSPAYRSGWDLEVLKEDALGLARKRAFTSFKINTVRSDKSFPFTSAQVNSILGEYILRRTPGVRVDLEEPELTCFVELSNREAYIYLDKIKGLGGLPSGIGGKVVALLSGGIDSPVASYKIMRRGSVCTFLHFHSYPFTDKASIDKVGEIAKVLNCYQLPSQLYLAPLAQIQQEIVAKTPPQLRVILYRRMMIRIAEQIAYREEAKALVTGDNLGQVASQTLDNLAAIDEASTMPILRPLIGEDKLDITRQAQEIGTYEISIAPYQDCCSLFIPRRPETKASLEKVKRAEKGLENIESLVAQAVEKTTIAKIE
jgi:thiamine biosynthesis protein ThiI